MFQTLIITDRDQVAGDLCSAFSRESTIARVATWDQAVCLHENKSFDVIFWDLASQKLAKENSLSFRETIRPLKRNNPLVALVVIVSEGQIRMAVSAVKEGASDYLSDPIHREEVRLVMEAIRQTRSRDLELDYLRDRFWKVDWLDIISTQSPAMQRIYEQVRSVAGTVATVLLQGETGTGKSLLARLIHWHSHRQGRPFIVTNCGTITETLIESELFGHEKGAFTDAVRRKPGRFDMAQGGTLFLDEIGTLSAASQVKLLQVLQDGEYSRVGGDDTIKADVRIIAATNANLKDEMERGAFRKDLYYRVSVFPIEIPPLRHRIEDIPQLCHVFLQTLDRKYDKGITDLSPQALDALQSYEWPGNIRELEHVLERAYILENAPVLTVDHFPVDIIGCGPMPIVDQKIETLPLPQARQIANAQFEKIYITNLVSRCKGRINLSAETAGITPRQLNRLMNRYGINKDDYKT